MTNPVIKYAGQSIELKPTLGASRVINQIASALGISGGPLALARAAANGDADAIAIAIAAAIPNGLAKYEEIAQFVFEEGVLKDGRPGAASEFYIMLLNGGKRVNGEVADEPANPPKAKK